MHTPSPLVSASILGADFARLGEEARDALAQGAGELHLDVMDGHFVPNLTMGPDITRAMRRSVPEATLDVHLMLENPGDFLETFAAAGADAIAFHVEVCDGLRAGGVNAEQLIQRIRAAGARPALAINPDTDPKHLEPYLPYLDRVLVMSVYPGLAGQKFLSGALSTLRILGEGGKGNPTLAVDGGVNAEIGPRCVEAGAHVLVAASSLFGAADRAKAIQAMMGRSTA